MTSKNELPSNLSCRDKSDEHYIINLCDEILGKKASRQHRFDFLLGDGNRPKMLPVDAYYEDLELVIEYHEIQHTEPVNFFDKRQTVSGCCRGEQRRIYDERRRQELPKHGISLVVISYTDFGKNKKLKRNRLKDIEIIKKILKDNGISF